MGRTVKLGTVMMDVPHNAGMNAANAVNAEHRWLINLDPRMRSTLKH